MEDTIAQFERAPWQAILKEWDFIHADERFSAAILPQSMTLRVNCT